MLVIADYIIRKQPPIEPVSTRIVHKEVWEDFKVELAKIWMSYKDFDGTLLKSRVHWAKVRFFKNIENY